jgi:hypothetical protein
VAVRDDYADLVTDDPDVAQRFGMEEDDDTEDDDLDDDGED